ncbi:TPA: glycine dehydrogenase subunit 2 [Candidatus Poribacteria bacterium]|nr:glycine dehydrogenase subunit 2 [Candidatus Poribacteria bacterium]
MPESLIFELSTPGRRSYSLPKCDVPEKRLDELIPKEFLRETEPNLPEVSELDVVRHFTGLSQLNHGVDTNFYPLGSCTMKYNPKVNEEIASLDGFSRLHPYQPEELTQGMLQLMYELERWLSEICGMAGFSLQPAAGAHGELLGLMLIHAYHESQGQKKKRVLVPDSAHGTNPASAARCGYRVEQVKSNEDGEVDIDSLKSAISDDVAALMLTNPNTLGLFETQVIQMAEIVHEAGGLLYYDGANANAILNICRPGDMGFDVVHLNLHKTFSSPHGGGGPGAGPVGVCEKLLPFLPVPTIVKNSAKSGQGGDIYRLNYDLPKSVGKIRAFYGNVGVLVKAYAYIRTHGADGLYHISENAIINANYMMTKLKKYYNLPYDRTCMHEFVLSADKQKKQNDVRALDIAKRLLDYGYHAPTVYFPLIVPEALMIEPTETESKETLDGFIEKMIEIAQEAESNPDAVKQSPKSTPVSRLDEVTAARKPNLKYKKNSTAP